MRITRWAESYGVWGEKTLYGKKYFGLTRSAFLIDETGRIVEAWPKISPEETVPKAIAALGGRYSSSLSVKLTNIIDVVDFKRKT